MVRVHPLAQKVIMFKRVIVVAGAPRSGTSWLGQIIDSSPEIAYRYQPLFSYAFKGALGFDSTQRQYNNFLKDIYESDDPFLLQADNRESGAYPTFEKGEASVLAFKTVRYHYLLHRMLEYWNMRLVAIVRHPCGTINSWLKTPREFPEGADPKKEWRLGSCKNQGRPEEFFGFYKWKELAHLYLDLAKKYPGRVYIIKYEDLVDNPPGETDTIFRFLGLEYGQQTRDFLEASHATHKEGRATVFKSPEVKNSWKTELDVDMAAEMIADLAGTDLARFLW